MTFDQACETWLYSAAGKDIAEHFFLCGSQSGEPTLSLEDLDPRALAAFKEAYQKWAETPSELRVDRAKLFFNLGSSYHSGNKL